MFEIHELSGATSAGATIPGLIVSILRPFPYRDDHRGIILPIPRFIRWPKDIGFGWFEFETALDLYFFCVFKGFS